MRVATTKNDPRSVSELCVDVQESLGGYARNRYSLWMGLEN